MCVCVRNKVRLGKKVKSEKKHHGKIGKSQPAHAPSANPVAWDGISNPAWCVTQHFTTGCRLCYLDLEKEAKPRSSVAGPSKHGMNRSGTLSPSPPHFAQTSSYPPVAGPPGGHRRRPAFCCWFVKIGGLNDDDDTRPALLVWLPPPLLSPFWMDTYPDARAHQIADWWGKNTAEEGRRHNTAKPPPPPPPSPRRKGRGRSMGCFVMQAIPTYRVHA